MITRREQPAKQKRRLAIEVEPRESNAIARVGNADAREAMLVDR